VKAEALLLALLLTAGTAGAQNVLDCRLAPGWEQTGATRQYSADNLYDYKDGGAEGYLAFGFVRMTGIDCKAGANTLTIDVSEMTDEDAAYGIFTANMDPAQPIAPIGMGGQIAAQSGSFAKGKYYVEIVEVAADSNANDAPLLKALATGIEARLEGRTAPPEPLKWFPPADLVSERMIPESVLGLRQLKRGFVAKYNRGQAFIVVENSPEEAAAAMKALREHFAGAAAAQIGDEGFAVKVQYLDGLCIFRKGRVVAGYANLPDAEQAAVQAAQLALRIP
jgi:hypothetical protein